MINKGLFTSDKNYWETPKALFDKLNNRYHFTLDPCSSNENAKCKKHYTLADNGLTKSWKNEIVFMNPPYGRDIGKWVEKAYLEYSRGGGYHCSSTSENRHKMVSRFYQRQSKGYISARSCEI